MLIDSNKLCDWLCDEEGYTSLSIHVEIKRNGSAYYKVIKKESYDI